MNPVSSTTGRRHFESVLFYEQFYYDTRHSKFWAKYHSQSIVNHPPLDLVMVTQGAMLGYFCQPPRQSLLWGVSSTCVMVLVPAMPCPVSAHLHGEAAWAPAPSSCSSCAAHSQRNGAQLFLATPQMCLACNESSQGMLLFRTLSTVTHVSSRGAWHLARIQWLAVVTVMVMTIKR